MKKNNITSLLNLVYMCISMTFMIFFLVTLAQLFGAWLSWYGSSDFPYSIEDFIVCLKLLWLGPFIGSILWFFYYKNV
jgi:hypothetical protein